MLEGQEILTTKKTFLNRNYIAILGLGGIIFIATGLTIALVLDNQKTYYEGLVNLFSKLGMSMILYSVIIFLFVNVIEPLTDKTYKAPFHYEVIYFSDRLMFKRYTENGGASESHQIFYPQIQSFNSEKNQITIELVFGTLDDKIEEGEEVDFLRKGNRTWEIENQRFRISKKLSKNDRNRLLDVLKIQIERAKVG